METGAKKFSGMVYFSSGQTGNKCKNNDCKNVKTLHFCQRMEITDRENPGGCLINNRENQTKKLC